MSVCSNIFTSMIISGWYVMRISKDCYAADRFWNFPKAHSFLACKHNWKVNAVTAVHSITASQPSCFTSFVYENAFLMLSSGFKLEQTICKFVKLNMKRNEALHQICTLGKSTEVNWYIKENSYKFLCIKKEET